MPSVIQTKMKPKIKKRPTASGSIFDNLEKLDTESEDFFKMLIYGRSGTGKTTLAGTFPGPLLWIVCSGGLKSGELKSLKDKKLLTKKDIYPHYVKKSSEILEIAESQQETGRFKTIVVDHVTGMQDKILAEILDIEDIPAQKSWGMASQQQYGQCSAQSKEMFKKLLNLDCNVLMLGQERNFHTDEDTHVDGINPYVSVALTPSLGGWLCPSVDYVIQTLIRPKMVEKRINLGIGKKMKTRVTMTRDGNKVEYVARLAPHDVVTTKFRLPKGHELPEFMVDPTYDKIVALLSGGAD